MQKTVARSFLLALLLLPGAAFAQGRTGSGSAGDQPFQEGTRLLESDDLPGAEEKFRAAISADAAYTPAYGKLGAVLFAQKKYKDAVSILEKCPDQKDLEVRLQLGLNLDKLGGASERAVQLLESVVKQNPARFEAQIALALHHQKRGEHKASIEAYEAYLKSRPQPSSDAARDQDNKIQTFLGTEYLLAKDFDAAARQFEALLKGKPNDLTLKLYLGASLVSKADTKSCSQAITLYEGILKEANKQPSIYFNYGQCLLRVGRASDAERNATAYVRAKPTDAKGHILLGEALYQQKRCDRALPSFQQASSLDKVNPTIVAKIGLTDVCLKNYDAAIAELERAETQSPNDVEILCAEVDAYGAKKLKDKLSAKADKLAPLIKDQKALRCAASAYAQIGNDDKAKSALESILQLDANDGQAKTELVRVYNRMAGKLVEHNELARAQMLLVDAERLQGDNVQTNRNLGLVYLLAKKCGDAESPLAKALKKSPNDPALNRLLARAQLCQGRKKDAQVTYQKAEQIALRTRGVELANVYAELGPLLVEAGLADNAVTMLETAVREAAGSSNVLAVAQRNLALAYFARGAQRLVDKNQPAESALADIKSAVDAPRGTFTNHEQTVFACFEGMAALKANKIQEAQEAFARAEQGGGCQYKPPYEKVGAAFFAAYAGYRDSGNVAKREAALKKLTQLQSRATPALGEVLKPLVRSLYELLAFDYFQRSDEGKAVANLRLAAKSPAKGNRRELENNLAALDMLSSGKAAAAERALEALGGSPPEALVNLGILKDRAGDSKAALSLYRQALAKGARSPKLREWIDVKQRIYGGGN